MKTQPRTLEIELDRDDLCYLAEALAELCNQQLQTLWEAKEIHEKSTVMNVANFREAVHAAFTLNPVAKLTHALLVVLNEEDDLQEELDTAKEMIEHSQFLVDKYQEIIAREESKDEQN